MKDFRALFVFTDKDKLTAFIEKGWDFSGQADAAAKSDDKGAAIAEAGTVVPRATVVNRMATIYAVAVSRVMECFNAPPG